MFVNPVQAGSACPTWTESALDKRKDALMSQQPAHSHEGDGMPEPAEEAALRLQEGGRP